MKISIYHYELLGRGCFYGSGSVQVRDGVLLRVQFNERVVGYADCHPWVELGDAPLSEQLRLLRRGTPTVLVKRSLNFARLDAQARESAENLFTGLSIPPSHFLLLNLTPESFHLIEKAIEQGFGRIKIKMGRRFKAEVELLKQLLIQFSSQRLKIRLDFNHALSINDFYTFAEELKDWKEQIEFCEDPFFFHADSWRAVKEKTAMNLACDYQSEQAIGYAEVAPVLVIKPAIQHECKFLEPSCKEQRLVVTSYLDHPLGQLAAAYTAAQIHRQVPRQIDLCGLMTHLVYEPNAFSEQLDHCNAVLIPPQGSGFGFDGLLQHLKWSAL